jgi:hypothetical protein
VANQTRKRRRHPLTFVYPIILVLGVDISLIVMKKKHFIRIVKAGDAFALSIVREGIQLHETS